MATIARTATFTDGTTAYGSEVETEFDTVYDAWNAHDAATSTWTSVKATTIIGVTSLTIQASSNQIVIGTTNTTTLTFTAPAASRVYTFPDAGAAAEVVLTAGSSTITGTKAFTSSSGTGFGNTPSASTLAGIDIWSGGLAVIVGADSAASTRTNSTTKIGRIGSVHYTNAQAPVAIAVVTADSTTNIVTIGGGSSLLTAATTINFNTATNSTTTDGTTVGRFDFSATATHTRLLVWDVDNAALERVTVGAADSGGAGFKLLRIPN